MRLTTLSRKIDKTPTQLIAFLEKREIHLEKGLHSILEKETVELVLSHFLPDSAEEPSAIPLPEPEAVLAAKDPEVVVPEEIVVQKPEPVKAKKEVKKATVKKKKKESVQKIEVSEPPQVVEEIGKAEKIQSALSSLS